MKLKLSFYRGYLESFSTGLSSPRTTVNNIISKTENSNPKSENTYHKLNESTDINENNGQTKESENIKNEIINEV